MSCPIHFHCKCISKHDYLFYHHKKFIIKIFFQWGTKNRKPNSRYIIWNSLIRVILHLKYTPCLGQIWTNRFQMNIFKPDGWVCPLSNNRAFFRVYILLVLRKFFSGKQDKKDKILKNLQEKSWNSRVNILFTFYKGLTHAKNEFVGKIQGVFWSAAAFESKAFHKADWLRVLSSTCHALYVNALFLDVGFTVSLCFKVNVMVKQTCNLTSKWHTLP